MSQVLTILSIFTTIEETFASKKNNKYLQLLLLDLAISLFVITLQKCYAPPLKYYLEKEYAIRY